MEGFYEKMADDVQEGRYFEPPFDDGPGHRTELTPSKPFGEEQERVDLAETSGDDEDNTEGFDRVAWLSKMDDLLGEGWDD